MFHTNENAGTAAMKLGPTANNCARPNPAPPQLPKGSSIDEVRKTITETEWWIISVKKLYNLPDHDGLEYLQQIEPVDKIAYAYHVYRIDPLPEAESSTSPADDSSDEVPSDN
jgi:hypothetical protein